jgi:cytochrome b561
MSNTPASRPAPQWADGARSFGWVSILLHWSGAIVVISLLFVGNSIHARGADGDAALKLHTTIALSAYALLWARLAWRWQSGHPERLPRQRLRLYAIARPFHWLLLGALGIMLVTGPVMAWSGGLPLRFFSLEIPAPITPRPWLFSLMHAGHVAAAMILGWGTLLHVLAAIKHVAIDRDGAFDRMMAPPRRGESGAVALNGMQAAPQPEGRSEMTHAA